jgi:hypothetical protein
MICRTEFIAVFKTKKLKPVTDFRLSTIDFRLFTFELKK